MMQDLAALAAPAIVLVFFIWGVAAVVRRELAPRRRAGARAEAGSDAPPAERADREQGAS